MQAAIQLATAAACMSGRFCDLAPLGLMHPEAHLTERPQPPVTGQQHAETFAILPARLLHR